ncbi:methyl-accepting chemotaxis protein [Cohnella sp.]|uniref:methyl-accepting chemotaxis protein n=1 Tax=Cohnella sp. TaxID=1883426 RepID=UPI003561BA3A
MGIFAIRSIRTRIMLIIMPMIIAAMAVLSIFTYQNSKALINREIESKMQHQLSSTTEYIETQLTAHSKIPETLARALEATGDHIEQEVIIDMIMKYLSTNTDTFGVGVWYEPKQYKKHIEYFGPYAYRYNGQIQYTLDSSTKEYDYPNRDFYLIGKETGKPVEWTNPYFDESSKSAVLTTTAPFYHYNREFRGVVTANINLEHLQKLVASIQVGASGRAFLIDRQGTYIADQDGSKLLKVNISEDINEGLAEIGNAMVANANGFDVYEESGSKSRIYYQEIPATGWKLAMVIPENELYKPLNELLLKSAITILITLLVISLVIYLFARYMKRQIYQVNVLSSAMASGDFTRSIVVKSQDEFGSMASDLNRMTQELSGVIKQMSKSAELVASTSEQLTYSTEQTTKATEEIAESIQSVAAGSEVQVTMMNDANVKVADTSRGLSEMSRRMASVSQASGITLSTAIEGNETIQIAVEQVQIMDEKAQHVAQIIESLSSKSEQIDLSMELIGKIAFQTRILALNAGITASQAGSHGKAFMVIAEEIRALAENSSLSGQQIQETIGEIQADIHQAMEAMDTNRKAVSSGKIKIEHAGRSFERIVNAVQEVSEETKGVSQAIESINGNMTEMVKAIRQITDISSDTAHQTSSVSASTEEQMASMEEMSAGASTLASLASELKETIRRFIV